MQLKLLIKIPKIQMAAVLVLIFFSAFLYQPQFSKLTSFLLAVGSTVLADLIFLKLRSIKPFFPKAGLVTGLIIWLLFAPNLPLYEIVAVGVIAMAAKHLLRIDKRHIFNPAGLGSFLVGTVFSHEISWWGVSWQQLSLTNFKLLSGFLLLLVPGLISVIRLRRWGTIGAFWSVYLLGTWVIQVGSGQNFHLNLDPTTLFFSLVMLPEPVTTPIHYSPQIWFGFFVGIISLLVSLPQFSAFLPVILADSLVLALLLGNLVFFKYK